MTVVVLSLTGASSSSEIWDSINWKIIKAEVHRLQIRIAKAISEGQGPVLRPLR